MNEDLRFYIRCLSRFIYVVTDDEYGLITNLRKHLAKHASRMHVYNSAFGLMPIDSLIEDWRSRYHKESGSPGIHEALISMYRDDPGPATNFYIITDPDRWLQDPQVVRRLLNIAHQLHQNENLVKVTIFVGPRLVIPQKLQHYIEVVEDPGADSDDIMGLLNQAAERLKIDFPESVSQSMRGLTTQQVTAVISQSIIQAKKNKVQGVLYDENHIKTYRKKQLRKTNLLEYCEVEDQGFDKVAGLERFKGWVNRNKAAWTPEGQAWGLRPPRGVLLVGVWGCGKSISVKALGHAWSLPVIKLEMGKLRSSGVGDSESNIYRALAMIEAVGPCVVWIDEAEKSLSGGSSSDKSDAGTTSRMIGILSTWIQETKSDVCLAMTVNSLGTLPIEFVRRMTERFFFDLPSEEERVDILKIHLKQRRQDPAQFNLASLADDSKLMVGSEIEHAIETAMTESFHNKKKGLDESLLSKELKNKPRIFKTLANELKEVLDWVGYDPETGDGIRARFASETKGEGFRAHQIRS